MKSGPRKKQRWLPNRTRAAQRELRSEGLPTHEARKMKFREKRALLRYRLAIELTKASPTWLGLLVWWWASS
jgi:hypothetical protein